MKYLCVCQKGNSRSVALAWLLKKKYGAEAIPIGIDTCGTETKEMLYDWADKIILVSNRYENRIPDKYKDKLKIWHVGTDIWFKGFNNDLIQKYEEYINGVRK